MSNLTNWEFFSTDYKPVTQTNQITLGSPVTVPSLSTSLTQSQYNFFGFGKTYEDGSVYYEQLLTSANETSVDFTVRGMGLPSATFQQYAELLRVATSGGATCSETQGGICYLPFTCDQYPLLWEFSFAAAWEQDVYAIMSIGTFASDANGICEIYIEYQDDSATSPPTATTRVNFGAMFFQAFSYQQSVGLRPQIWVNENAWTTTQISQNASPVPGPNPFVVIPVSLPASPAT